MLSMLLAYNAEGRVVATLDYMVACDSDGTPRGLVDFEAVEDAGDIKQAWNVENAVGAGTWPEWLGARAHEFRVEVDPTETRRIRRLTHVGGRPRHKDDTPTPGSGHVRERVQVEQAIADRIAQAKGEPADIRDLVGGPERAMKLDEKGRSLTFEARPPSLPMVALDSSPTARAGHPDSGTTAKAGRPSRE